MKLGKFSVGTFFACFLLSSSAAAYNHQQRQFAQPQQVRQQVRQEAPRTRHYEGRAEIIGKVPVQVGACAVETRDNYTRGYLTVEYRLTKLRHTYLIASRADRAVDERAYDMGAGAQTVDETIIERHAYGAANRADVMESCLFQRRILLRSAAGRVLDVSQGRELVE